MHPADIGEAGALTAHTGEAWPICCAYDENLQIFLLLHTLPLSGVKIAEPIVLAESKGHKRIGKAQKRMHHASPIVYNRTHLKVHMHEIFIVCF